MIVRTPSRIALAKPPADVAVLYRLRVSRLDGLPGPVKCQRILACFGGRYVLRGAVSGHSANPFVAFLAASRCDHLDQSRLHVSVKSRILGYAIFLAFKTPARRHHPQELRHGSLNFS